MLDEFIWGPLKSFFYFKNIFFSSAKISLFCVNKNSRTYKNRRSLFNGDRLNVNHQKWADQQFDDHQIEWYFKTP